MPVNKKYNILKLLEACKYYVNKTGRRITFEYTLINKKNDYTQNAEELSNLLKGILCHVNLIPVNSVYGTGFVPGSERNIREFQNILEKNGIPATVWREMGSDISAACGQLRSQI